MKKITVQELKDKIDSQADFQLIDVREPYEYDISNIGFDLIPMGEIMENVDKIKKDIPVLVMCRSGKRSAAVIDSLESNFGFENLHNVEGGINAYADQIDDNLEIY